MTDRRNILPLAAVLSCSVCLIAILEHPQGGLPDQAGLANLADQIAAVRGAVVHIEKLGECQGSGAILTPDGICMTAKHVTDHTPGQYRVTLDDGKTAYRVKYAIEDKEHDVAFLLLDLPPGVVLPTVQLADLSTMRVGDPLFIMGSPFGWANFNSVSLGILSAMQRDLDTPQPSGYGWQVTFQSTSPVYPGVSGGPVFNMRGEVIGVLVAGVDATLNYSVPVGVFRDRLDAVRTWFALSRFVPVPERAPEKALEDPNAP